MLEWLDITLRKSSSCELRGFAIAFDHHGFDPAFFSGISHQPIFVVIVGAMS